MMYADNLGKIPPNTSLMIITAGTKRYELRISSSEKKSAVVRFRYQPKKEVRPTTQ
jgi:type IV secretory pathway VirB9-like protein